MHPRLTRSDVSLHADALTSVAATKTREELEADFLAACWSLSPVAKLHLRDLLNAAKRSCSRSRRSRFRRSDCTAAGLGSSRGYRAASSMPTRSLNTCSSADAAALQRCRSGMRRLSGKLRGGSLTQGSAMSGHITLLEESERSCGSSLCPLFRDVVQG